MPRSVLGSSHLGGTKIKILGVSEDYLPVPACGSSRPSNSFGSRALRGFNTHSCRSSGGGLISAQQCLSRRKLQGASPITRKAVPIVQCDAAGVSCGSTNSRLRLDQNSIALVYVLSALQPGLGWLARLEPTNQGSPRSD